MGLFGKKPVKGAPKRGERVCPVHGVHRPGVCTKQCTEQIRHAQGYSESDRAQERSSIDPNSGW
jgi:hypothetical protein